MFASQESSNGKGGMCPISEKGTYYLQKVPLGSVVFTIIPQEKTGKTIEIADPTGRKIAVDEVLPMLKGGRYDSDKTTVTLTVTQDMRDHTFTLTEK